MGEGANGVKAEPPKTKRLEQRVAMIRGDLGNVVRELEARRHALTDVKGQLQRHAPVAALVGSGVLLLAGGALGLSVYRARKRRALVQRAKQQLAYESILHRALTAAAGAVFGVLAKSLATRFVKPVIEAGGQPPSLPSRFY